MFLVISIGGWCAAGVDGCSRWSLCGRLLECVMEFWWRSDGHRDLHYNAVNYIIIIIIMAIGPTELIMQSDYYYYY